MIYDDETKQKAIRLVRDGMSRRQVSELLQVPAGTITGWCLRAHVYGPVQKPVRGPNVTPAPYFRGLRWPAAYRRSQG